MSERLGGFSRALMRIPVPWVFVLAYLAGVGLEAVCFQSHFFSATPLISEVGALVFLAGAGLAAWGWLLFRRARTTRVPGRASSTMVIWGPYRFTRNPMYLGLTIAYLGEAGILRQLWPVLLLPLVLAYLNWIVIPVEEEKLRQVFGTRYEKYRARVGRWV
ncbi:MAG TPA: isoprenylcysteine carboxylmethyltransferase family protein [Terriglobia bacterium]|nr:isoprenylcysteine carboxylmethyltransferase family protein [Terriglobia bacterium]